MFSEIETLYKIAKKQERNIIGLMSGTSLDGLDIAHCIVSGHGRTTKVELKNFLTIPYSEEFRDEIKRIFSVKEGDIEHLVLLHAFIGQFHGDLINIALKTWGLTHKDIDLVASHGQTIYHAPSHLHKNENYGNATLQIGDGDHLAVTTGIITLSDFRMKHIAAGGEGAPLAVYADNLIFSKDDENRVLLNIGGIANFTWLPSVETESILPCFSTDIGPGNTMMNAFIQKYYKDMDYDVDGKIARSGKVDSFLLSKLMKDDFFTLGIPKTIGPELFNLQYLENALASLDHRPSNVDILSTLNTFSSEVIVTSLETILPKGITYSIYASGGGIHNLYLMDQLKEKLSPIEIKNTKELNIHPDAKEAVLFALLANEAVAGDGEVFNKNIAGVPNVSMGKICLPR
jgi:anhydro-N-acetylmuramic acid kinase